ncbi:MAG: endonuclease [Spirochaetia bacterium]
MLGAILTQNTAWTNVETALARLRRAGIVLPRDVLAIGRGGLAGLIRSSGYFNQKARKLAAVASLLASPGALTLNSAPSRETLLSQWGIGPETADSILLYAFHVPVFVIDAYTRRILSRIGLVDAGASYEHLQDLFHVSLPPDTTLFNEYHALLVRHAKEFCMRSPQCTGCPVGSCRYRKGA